MNYFIPKGQRGERIAKWMVKHKMAEVYTPTTSDPIAALFDGFIWVLTWCINKFLNAIEKMAVALLTYVVSHKLVIKVVRR